MKFKNFSLKKQVMSNDILINYNSQYLLNEFSH